MNALPLAPGPGYRRLPFSPPDNRLSRPSPNLHPVAPPGPPGRCCNCYTTNTPEQRVMQTPWTEQGPIYQQLADRLAVQLLDGQPGSEAMPSVRQLASSCLINPLTVTRALQTLAGMAWWRCAGAWACM